MEIDATPVPPPQEYSDNPSAYQSESSMNFDYLQGLNENNRSSRAHPGGADIAMDSTRYFGDVAENAPSTSSGGASGTTYGASYGYVDDKAVDRPYNLNERFVSVLDQLDARVEKFRKDALGLQEKKDFLLMSIDLIKSHDMLQNMMECEREEINLYIQRVSSRLSTVELNVRTVRDHSQEDSLSQINVLIDAMITMGDPLMARQRCQQYLNSCCSSVETDGAHYHQTHHEHVQMGTEMDAGPVDKKFESALLGCTLDDQKNVKKRLQALMSYLNKQIVRLH